MRWEFKLAMRISNGKEKSFASIIIRIASLAVALSIAVMIVTTALITGFKTEISSKIFGFWGHLHINAANVYQNLLEIDPIEDNQDFYPVLKNRQGIKAVQVYAIQPGIVKGKNDLDGIFLKGIGSDFNWQFFKTYLQEGDIITFPTEEASNQIIISKQTASRLSLKTGDNFRLFFVKNGTMLKRNFKISGIYKTGLEEYDSKFALVDIRKVQQLQGWAENQIGGYEVFIDDISMIDHWAEEIYSNVLPPDLNVQSIRDKLPEIFEWLSLQDINEVVILSLMIVVAIINMVTALLILMLERTRMIGILKSLGSSNWSIRRIFMFYAGIIASRGMFWGNIIGISICLLQKYGHFIKLSEENYYLNEAPILINFSHILFLNLGTILVIVLFLILPTWLITRISPVRTLRMD
jgi:lipoprotein-releasing system permease protein